MDHKAVIHNGSLCMIVKLEEKTYRVVEFSQSYRRKKSGEKLL